MELTDGEKLILLMMTELYQKLNVEGEIEPEFIRSAIFNEQTWGIPWKYSGIPFSNQEDPPIVAEVLDILQLWDDIEYTYTKLSKDEQQLIEQKVEVFGKNPKFPGFDGNNESEYLATAYFLINDLERFERFKGRDLNSHMPLLENYHRMLEVFKPIRRSVLTPELSANNLIEILSAIRRR